MKKIYVTVDYNRDQRGNITPRKIIWKDGRILTITRVLHFAFPTNGEFEGIRYTVLIENQERYLYQNNDVWYVVAN